jgi:hypothetical protein
MVLLVPAALCRLLLPSSAASSATAGLRSTQRVPARPRGAFSWLQDTPKGRLLLKDDARGAIDGTIFHK